MQTKIWSSISLWPRRRFWKILYLKHIREVFLHLKMSGVFNFHTLQIDIFQNFRLQRPKDVFSLLAAGMPNKHPFSELYIQMQRVIQR